MSYSPQDLFGAVDKMTQLLTNNSAALTAKSQNPTALKAALNTSKDDSNLKDADQEDAKRALKDKTKLASDSLTSTYNLLSSTIDLAAGAVGKTTNLGKQILKIRADLNKKHGTGGGGGGGSSSSSSGGGSSSSSSGGDPSSSSS